MISTLQTDLEATFKGVEVTVLEDSRMSVFAPSGSIAVVLRYLKESGFDHLALVSCVDWIKESKFEVVYVLTCYMRNDTDYTAEQRFHVLLRTQIPRNKPALRSVIDVFENAEPYEREMHELYGVDFHGHPRLIPLFLERDYETPPFRKDFDTREYVEETFGSIPPVGTQRQSRGSSRHG
jgi:NADH-quinone oxidoreductase subunit C